MSQLQQEKSELQAQLKPAPTPEEAKLQQKIEEAGKVFKEAVGVDESNPRFITSAPTKPLDTGPFRITCKEMKSHPGHLLGLQEPSSYNSEGNADHFLNHSQLSLLSHVRHLSNHS